jgi:AcrR family transcriptional regulator
MTKPTAKGAAKRGRPSLARAAAIEKLILNAGSELFLRDGFDLVTMEGIAAAANISKTTLYSRYPSKESLLEAIIRDRIAQWSAIASRRDHLMTDDLGNRLRYHACTIARMTRLPDVQAFVRLLSAYSDRFPNLSRAMHDAGYLYIVDFVRRDIETATRREGKPARDADSVARHFVNSIAGWILQESAGRDLKDAEVEAAALRCAELILAARDHW